MREFIGNMLAAIMDDFKQSISQMDTLCRLKDQTFEGGRSYDYGQPASQQLYLLRYGAAYIAEYRFIYRQLLNMQHLDSLANVLSIGAGPCLDYYGLDFALRERGRSAARSSYYTGVDIVDWPYRWTLGNDDYEYIAGDIAEVDEIDEDTNVVIFPKSIGEFDDASFNLVLDTIGGWAFESDRLVLVLSARSTYADEKDLPRFRRVVNRLCRVSGYRCEDHLVQSVTLDNRGFSNYCDGFCVPDSIVDYMTDLVAQCPKRRRNGRQCYGSCDKLNRHPLTSAGQVSYNIARLSR